MGKEKYILIMVIYMKVILLMGNLREKENFFGKKMGKSILEIIKMVYLMVMENINGMKKNIIKENIKKVLKKEKENYILKMEKFLFRILLMVNRME